MFHLQLSQEEKNNRLNYWHNTLKDLNSLHLQADFLKKNVSGKQIAFDLEADLVEELERQFYTYSLNEIILTSLYALLYHYSGETSGLGDICLGISERLQEGVTNSFIDTIPLRLNFSSKISFIELLSLVKISRQNILENLLPLSEILQKNTTINDVYPFNISLAINTKNSSPIESEKNHVLSSYFDIHLDIMEDKTYRGFFEINTNLFEDKTIVRFIAHWQKALQYMAKHPEELIDQMPFILDEEKLLIEALNKTEKIPAYDGLVHDYFNHLAEKNTDKIAVVFHEASGKQKKITYGELDVFTTKLANYMNQATKKTGQENQVIGICLTRSINLMSGIIASLKSGHPFITLENTDKQTLLDHKLQKNHFLYIIVDEKTKLLFANRSHFSLINIEEPVALEKIGAADPVYQSSICSPNDLAYIVYTSGTTGEPKAVMITHEGFSNLLNALIHQNFTPNSRILSIVLPTFDAFLTDWLTKLATYGEQHLCYEEGRYNPQVLANIIKKADINSAVFLPDLFNQVDPELPLEDITSMGAMAQEETMERWYKTRPTRRIMNGYGPTETTIILTIRQYKIGDDVAWIGNPIANMKIYILNTENFSVCPLGVPGEIYIAGPGVAKGYANNTELTNQKFPTMFFHADTYRFSKDENTYNGSAIKLYASGDRAFYQLGANNKLEIKLIGRKDRQLKIHGVRVELDGVETILRRHNDIKNIIVAKKEDETFLTAYVIPQLEANPADTYGMLKKIRGYLFSTALSPVSYPHTLVLLSEFPFTNNGKIDIPALKALPTPITLPESELPKTACQKTLLAFWANVLGYAETWIGVNMSWEALGGNSFTVTRLANRIKLNIKLLNLKKAISVKMAEKIFFKEMTIVTLETSLSPYIENKKRALQNISLFAKKPHNAYNKKSISEINSANKSIADEAEQKNNLERRSMT